MRFQTTMPRSMKVFLQFAGGVLLFVLVVALDLVTGYEIASSIFYFIPILYFVLLFDKRLGVLAAVASAVLWLLSDLVGGHPYSHFAIPYWNAFVRLVIFMTVCLIVSRLRAEIKSQKERNLTLAKANEEILRLSRIKSEFASMVSHELRTPMAAIRESIRLVQDGLLGDVHEEQKPYLQMAQRNIDRLINMINDILDFSKLEEGKQRLHLAQHDLAKIIHESVDFYMPMSKHKGLDIEPLLSDNLPQVVCDADKIRQALGNLIGNAVKFTDSGKISLEANKLKHSIEVSVSDTGCGIAETELKSIFEPFVQLDRQGEARVRGTGLGLAICKKIVNLHGGKIWAKSEVGKGTTVIFTLPLQKKRLSVDRKEIA